MEFEFGTAIVAGLAGTVVMTVLMYMGAMMNMKMDIPAMLGTMFLPRGPAAYVLGLMVHLMMGAAFFVLYAILFELLSIESGIVAWAAVFGIVHGAMAGAAMGMMPMMHPRMATAGANSSTDFMEAPGMFASRFGMMGPVALLAMHAVYGAVGGLIYA